MLRLVLLGILVLGWLFWRFRFSFGWLYFDVRALSSRFGHFVWFGQSGVCANAFVCGCCLVCQGLWFGPSGFLFVVRFCLEFCLWLF